ncbi:tryptophan-rich sensory protein [Chloroflexota bacterium]
MGAGHWLFAPAWITLYLLMAVSASIVWQRGLGNRPVRTSLAEGNYDSWSNQQHSYDNEYPTSPYR